MSLRLTTCLNIKKLFYLKIKKNLCKDYETSTERISLMITILVDSSEGLQIEELLKEELL